MKTNFLFIAVLLLMASCSSNETKKAETNASPAKDSSVVDLPLTIEKEFSDSVTVKPEKDSVLLAFNFLKGKVYNYTMNFDMDAEKQGKKIENKMRWSYNMEVVDEKNSIKTIKTTYQKIEMAMDMLGSGQMIEYSSEKKVDSFDLMQMPSRMFAAIKGKSFLMDVNRKGEILSISGFDKIGEAVVNELNLPAQMKVMALQNFKRQFSDESVKQLFSQFFSIFPGRFVKTGDSWQRQGAIKGPMQVNNNTTYSVKDIRKGMVYLTATSKFDADEGKSSGGESGKLIVDAKTGLVTQGSFDQKIKGEQNLVTQSKIIGKQY